MFSRWTNNCQKETGVQTADSITQAGDLLIENMCAVIKERTLWESISDSKVVISELGEKCIALGAATQVLQATLDDKSLFPLKEAPKETRANARGRFR
jgi:hypothetical protein